MESKNKGSGQTTELTIEDLNNAVLKWKSDLQFYKDDLIFIQHIMDHYLSVILLNENLDEIRESTMRLEDLKYRCNGLLKSIASFRRKIGDSFQEGVNNALLTGHSTMKVRIKDFKSDFKALKVEIFSIADRAIEIGKKEKRTLDAERIRTDPGS